MKPPSKQATWAGVAMLALTILSSYIGIKYERHQVSQAQEVAPVAVDVTVSGNDSHSHSAVVSQTTIKALVAAAIAAQHQKDLEIFKKKETWDD